MEILEKLIDLHQQATKERSHYYVASTVVEAIKEIGRLRRINFEQEQAIRNITPWLSASLTSGVPCEEYIDACNKLFELDKD